MTQIFDKYLPEVFITIRDYMGEDGIALRYICKGFPKIIGNGDLHKFKSSSALVCYESLIQYLQYQTEEDFFSFNRCDNFYNKFSYLISKAIIDKKHQMIEILIDILNQNRIMVIYEENKKKLLTINYRQLDNMLSIVINQNDFSFIDTLAQHHRLIKSKSIFDDWIRFKKYTDDLYNNSNIYLISQFMDRFYQIAE